MGSNPIIRKILIWAYNSVVEYTSDKRKVSSSNLLKPKVDCKIKKKLWKSKII